MNTKDWLSAFFFFTLIFLFSHSLFADRTTGRAVTGGVNETNETHMACQNLMCVNVSGPGNNTCSVDLDCQNMTNMSEGRVRRGMGVVRGSRIDLEPDEDDIPLAAEERRGQPSSSSPPVSEEKTAEEGQQPSPQTSPQKPPETVTMLEVILTALARFFSRSFG